MQSVAKAALAFLALLVANLWTNLTATGFVLPQNVSGWAAFIITTVVGTVGVWAKANTSSDPAVVANQSVRASDSVPPTGQSGGIAA